ncbi:hypothetical protein GYMLUDRAFT_662384 [Collybiopsis luxurians FD-317 M1]|uniref:Unplaced genomic scaffold GYMLUscaffold_30, whole genome shotgun sequence n=1 Tax=Collybiopsis luxurians FD-317 M1 TaxID=944289 RepID=A0A0D0B8E8_9AGAR|nr:hypothetical protein GYMLUDRAFT_662384 [Collybiopsis luxurians FD-317 M1]
MAGLNKSFPRFATVFPLCLCLSRRYFKRYVNSFAAFYLPSSGRISLHTGDPCSLLAGNRPQDLAGTLQATCRLLYIQASSLVLVVRTLTFFSSGFLLEMLSSLIRMVSLLRNNLGPAIPSCS